MITSYGNKLDRIMGKAFAESYVKLKPKDIVEQVNLDPTVTGIDVVVTYSAALKGITQEIRNVKKAFSGKHPDIKLIILADDGKTDVIAKGENVFYENISRNFDAEDVKYAVEGKSNVNLVNRPCGEWLKVEEIVSAAENIMEKNYATSI